jgi:hypothetical protein
MHIEYIEMIYPSQHSLEHLTIPQIERIEIGLQIKESFKVSFHKAPKRL